MEAIKWIKSHAQISETKSDGIDTWTTSVFSGVLNPKMRKEVKDAFYKLPAYTVGGTTRLFGEAQVSFYHSVETGKTTLIFTEYES